MDPWVAEALGRLIRNHNSDQGDNDFPDRTEESCKHQIPLLASVAFNAFPTADISHIKCSICQDYLKHPSHTVTHLLCKNSWHISCLYPWIKITEEQGLGPKCTLCRAPFRRICPGIYDESIDIPPTNHYGIVINPAVSLGWSLTDDDLPGLPTYCIPSSRSAWEEILGDDLKNASMKINSRRTELLTNGVQTDIPTRDLIFNYYAKYGFVIGADGQGYQLWQMGRLFGVEWWTEHRTESHLYRIFITPLIDFHLAMPNPEKINTEEKTEEEETSIEMSDSGPNETITQHCPIVGSESPQAEGNHSTDGEANQFVCLDEIDGSSQALMPTKILRTLVEMAAFSGSPGAVKACELLDNDVDSDIRWWALEREHKSTRNNEADSVNDDPNLRGEASAMETPPQSPDTIICNRTVSIVARPCIGDWVGFPGKPSRKGKEKARQPSSIPLSLLSPEDLGLWTEREEKHMKRYLKEIKDAMQNPEWKKGPTEECDETEEGGIIDWSIPSDGHGKTERLGEEQPEEEGTRSS